MKAEKDQKAKESPGKEKQEMDKGELTLVELDEVSGGLNILQEPAIRELGGLHKP